MNGTTYEKVQLINFFKFKSIIVCIVIHLDALLLYRLIVFLPLNLYKSQRHDKIVFPVQLIHFYSHSG